MARVCKAGALASTNEWLAASRSAAKLVTQTFADALEATCASLSHAQDEHAAACRRQADEAALDGAYRAGLYLKRAQAEARQAAVLALQRFFREVPRLDLLQAVFARQFETLGVAQRVCVLVHPDAVDADECEQLQRALQAAVLPKGCEVAVERVASAPAMGCEIETPLEVIRCDLDTVYAVFMAEEEEEVS
jgi:hypothetical protein